MILMTLMGLVMPSSVGDGGSKPGPDIGLSSLGEKKKEISEASLRFPCSSRAHSFSEDMLESMCSITMVGN